MFIPPGRFNRLISLLFLAALLISGCGGRQESTADPGLMTPEITPTQHEDISLAVWVVEQEDTFLPQLVEAFEQEHPGIDIVISQISVEKYASRFETALLESKGPDIALVVQPDWLASGKFLPLDSAIDAYRVPFDDFNAGAITRDCLYQGRVYCLGSLTSGTILVYNKDLFDLFHAPYPPAGEPLSMQAYHDLLLRLTQKSDKIEERIWGGEAAPSIQWMEPGTHISADGRQAAGFINDEATSKAYQWLADLYLQGAAMTEEEAELVQQDPLDLLIAGRQATALVDSATALPILEQSGIRWGAAIVPTEQTGDAKWASNRTDGLGVTSTSRYSEAAVQFLVFMAHRGSQLRLDRGEMPLNMRLAEQWAGGSEERRQVFAALQHGRSYPLIPGFSDAASHVWLAWERMIKEGVPAKVALDEITEPVQIALDQSWDEFEAIQYPEATETSVFDTR